MEDKPLLTEEEQTNVGRAMLAAALAALGDRPEVDAVDQDDIARRVVRALAAAAAVGVAEQKRLTEERGGHVYLEVEPHEAVATAFWMWWEHIDLDVGEVHASSVASGFLLGLAQGLAAARAMSEALDMLDDGSGFAFSSRGALHLAPRDPVA